MTTSPLGKAAALSHVSPLRAPEKPPPPLPLPKPLDLRRRDRRSQTEIIAACAHWLPRGDRALVHAVYIDGRTATEVAAMIGVPARALCARVRRLVTRLTSPPFAFVAANADHWPPALRAVAVACFIEGKPARRAAKDLGLSYHTVRQYHRLVSTMGRVHAAHPDRRL